MFPEEWGLRESPFRFAGSSQHYFPSATHVEVLARMDFLAESHSLVGVLAGPAGSGKSLLLEIAHQHLMLGGDEAVRMNLTGMDTPMFLGELAAHLCAACEPEDSTYVQWRALSDRFIQNRYQRIHTSILLDDVEAAPPEVLRYVQQLIHIDQDSKTAPTFLLACRTDAVERLDRRLLELCDLRMQIDPWNESDVGGYLEHCLTQVGGSVSLFAPEAVTEITNVSGGIVRRVARIAELSLLAAAGRSLSRVDRETVCSVQQELSGVGTFLS